MSTLKQPSAFVFAMLVRSSAGSKGVFGQIEPRFESLAKHGLAINIGQPHRHIAPVRTNVDLTEKLKTGIG